MRYRLLTCLLTGAGLLLTTACATSIAGTAVAGPGPAPASITDTATATAGDGAASGGAASGGSDGASDGGAAPTGGVGDDSSAPDGEATPGDGSSGMTQQHDSGRSAAAGTTAAAPDTSAALGGTSHHEAGGATPTAAAMPSSESTASVDAHGVITIEVGKPAAVIDLYEDALCPICGRFEATYGADVRTVIDKGRLAVRYRMVDFLNPESASGTYSTRALAAMLALTVEAGDKPGLVEAFHTSIFDQAFQPAERGSSDWSNAQFADLARQLGAPDKAVAAIANGSLTSRAAAVAKANLEELTRISQEPGTPTVAQHDRIVPISGNWLQAVTDGGAG